MKTYKKHITILFIFLILGGLLGLILLNGVSWDFLSYHYYNGWAFLNNRLNTDIFAAMFRTYYNPLPDAFTYILITKLNSHPYTFLFINGLKLGLFLYLTYLLYDILLIKKGLERKLLIILCTLLTFITPLLLACLDFSNVDIQLNCLALITFIIFIKTFHQSFTQKKVWLILLCGILIGCATGLKYSMLSFGISILLCTFLFRKHIDKPFKTMFFAFWGMMLGFLCTNGWWMFVLWKHFNNPMFPYFNQIFQSPFCDKNSIFSFDFDHLRAKNLLDFISYPFKNSLNECVGYEWRYYDLKIPCAYISMIIYYMINKYKTAQNRLSIIIDAQTFDIIVIFTILVYSLNIICFGNYVFILALAPLTSIIIAETCYSFFEIFQKQKSSAEIFYIGIILLVCLSGFHIYAIEIFTILKIVLLISCFALLIYLFAYKNNLSDKTRSALSLLTLITILCTIKFVYPHYIIDNRYLTQIINVEKTNIKNGATVICGTMLANFIVPNQNKNAKYYGLPIPSQYAAQGIWNKNSIFRNKYFEDNTAGKIITKIFKEEKDVYFIYSKYEIGRENEDLDVYLKTLSKYSGKEIEKLNNCKTINYNILGEYNPLNKIKICKIK